MRIIFHYPVAEVGIYCRMYISAPTEFVTLNYLVGYVISGSEPSPTKNYR